MFVNDSIIVNIVQKKANDNLTYVLFTVKLVATSFTVKKTFSEKSK